MTSALPPPRLPLPIKPTSDGILSRTNPGWRLRWRGRKEDGEGGGEKGGGRRLHCLVPSRINNTRRSAAEIPFVIPFVLRTNSLISPLAAPAHAPTPACVRACAREPLLSPIYLSRCLLIIISASAPFIQMGSITF